MPSYLVTCPVRSPLKRGQVGNVLSTFLTQVEVTAAEEKVVQTSLVRKRGKDDAGKMGLVASEVVNA